MVVQANPSDPSTVIVTQRLERFVIRDIFGQGYYPFSRFTRLEIGGHFANITQDTLRQDYLVDRGSGAVLGIYDPVTGSGPSVSYYGPQLALVHDNSLFGWVGPFAGSRLRLGVARSFGSWKLSSGLVDWRRYFFARPVTLALRGLFFGRFGRDGYLFPQYLGYTQMLRGFTSCYVLLSVCV